MEEAGGCYYWSKCCKNTCEVPPIEADSLRMLSFILCCFWFS